MKAHAFAGAPQAALMPPPVAIAAPPPLIRLDAVSKTFHPRGGDSVIEPDEIDLAVAPAEIVGIIGHSGAGKSTLVRIINGLDKPTSGRVTVADVAISELAESDARAHAALHRHGVSAFQFAFITYGGREHRPAARDCRRVQA